MFVDTDKNRFNWFVKTGSGSTGNKYYQYEYTPSNSANTIYDAYFDSGILVLHLLESGSKIVSIYVQGSNSISL